MIKAVTLFLVFIAVLAMFGRLRWLMPKRPRLTKTKCPSCGRHRIGAGACPCGKG